MATHATTTKRDDRGEHDLRQVAGEVRLERLDPLHRGRGDLAGLRPVGRGRLRRQPARDERQAQLGEHARRRAPARDLHPPRQRAPAREGERQRDRVASQLARRRAREGPGDDPRQQRGLEHDERGRDDAERGVHDQQRAHGPRAADEARIEGAHGRPQPVGVPAGAGSSGSTGATAGGSPPRRARKTW